MFGRIPSLRLLPVALLVFPLSSAGAQLRPLDPIDWGALGGRSVTVEIGSSYLSGQRASLAGTEGRLVEVGKYRIVWHLGRVALQASGTALWLYKDRTVFAPPLSEVLPPKGSERKDVGDQKVTTMVELTPPGWKVGAALRFGVTLPTTDDLQGIGRDETDFFATVGGHTVLGSLDLGGELGLGINGTRVPTHEQVDPLLFGLSAVYQLGDAAAILELAGQHDTRPGPDFRGNEDLGEARLGVRIGRTRWLTVQAVRGWTLASPHLGVVMAVGARF
ncbi:MAG: hypothetical protein LJF04_16695 [Gemmatimonadetes bacterium]|nr:hypothetical protein [Gemmatimonadota bacterium]